MVLRADIDEKIGQNLRKIRKSKKLSQREIGKFINVSSQQIQKYESGQNRIAISTMIRLCCALGLTYDDFFKDIFDDLNTHQGIALPHQIHTDALDPTTRNILHILMQTEDTATKRQMHKVVSALKPC